MTDVAWSNNTSFPPSGLLEIGDSLVGLRSGLNVKFSSPTLQSTYNSSTLSVIDISASGLTLTGGNFETIGSDGSSVLSDGSDITIINPNDMGALGSVSVIQFQGKTPFTVSTVAKTSIGFNYEAVSGQQSGFYLLSAIDNGALNTFFSFYGKDASNPNRLLIGGNDSSYSNVDFLGVNVGYFGDENYSAIVQFDSTSKGFLPPRMTNSQMNSVDVSTTPTALLLYTTDTTKGIRYWDSAWNIVLSNANVIGDVTFNSSASATISSNVVTYSKIQTVAANSLMGNPTGSLANSQGITLGSALTFSSSSLQVAANGITPSMVSSGTYNINATTAISAGIATDAIAVNFTNISTNGTYFIPFVASQSTGYQSSNINTNLNFNPSTVTLSATTFNGALSGTATNASNLSMTATTMNSSFYVAIVQNTASNQPGFTSSTFSFNPSTGILNVTGIAVNGIASTLSLVATDSSKNLTSSVSALSPTFAGLTITTNNPQIGNLHAIGFNTANLGTFVGQVGPVATSGKTDMGIFATGSANWLRLGTNNALVAFFVKNQIASTDAWDAAIDASGNFKLANVGTTIYIKEGTNSCKGTSTLSGTSTTISTTAVATGDAIFITVFTVGGTQGLLSYTINNGASFVVTSSTGILDTSIIKWWIVKAA